MINSKNNSELFFFLKTLFWKLMVFIILCFGVFFLSYSNLERVEITRNTDHFKIAWIEDQLLDGRIKDSTILFFGSSICQNAVNDSLLNQSILTRDKVFNCGINHPCNGMTYLMLQRILVEAQVHPKKVFLCLKSNSLYKSIHRLFGAIAEPTDVLNAYSNGHLYPSLFFEKVAWNSHQFSRFFKYDIRDKDRYLGNSFGFVPKKPNAEVLSAKNIYSDSLAITNMLAVMNKELASGAIDSEVSWHQSMSNYALDNFHYQDNMFLATARLLEKYNVPFDIILYPEFNLKSQDDVNVIADYYRLRYSEIAFSKHKIIAEYLPELKDVNRWADLNHLNETGANVFTKHLLNYLPDSNSVSTK
jgi:hypothetical protein